MNTEKLAGMFEEFLEDLKEELNEAASESEASESEASEDEAIPMEWIKIGSFEIGKYPVTNAQYEKFTRATGHPCPSHWVGEHVPEDKKNHPVVNVSWHDAKAFCAWSVCRLPTEAEWELAAAGDGEEKRTYPWGNDEPSHDLANYDYKQKGTTPVGMYPQGATPEGVMDMAGNVWEWVEDEWR